MGDEIDEYVKDLLKNYQEFKDKKPELVELARRNVEIGQMLSCVGRNSEALPYLRQAWEFYCNNIKTVSTHAYYDAGIFLVQVLDYLGDVNYCEMVFHKLNDSHPKGFHIGDYAFFLHRRKREFDKAESMYKLALETYPLHSSIHLKYAGFLRHVRRNMKAAEDEYRKAVESDPNHADALGNFASFLHSVYKDIPNAEKYYQLAVQADETHANNLCNYGLFLSEEKTDFDGAESMYQRALAVTPNHSNTLYNYAVLLDTHLKRREDAEGYYRQTITLEPRHAYALYNIAVLLEEQFVRLQNASPATTTGASNNPNHTSAPSSPSRQSQAEVELTRRKTEVCDFYRRAAEADPKDANSLADYGRFLYIHVANVVYGEQILVAALKLDPQCEVAKYHYALLIYKEKKQLQKGMELIKEILQANPQHINAYLTFARMYSDIAQSGHQDSPWKGQFGNEEKGNAIDQAMSFYERAIGKVIEPVIVCEEYLRFISLYGSSKQKLTVNKFAVSIIPILNRQMAGLNWDPCHMLIEEIKSSL